MTTRPARLSSRTGAAALRYAAHGWPVLALHTSTGDGCSCGHVACPKPGKHPRTRRGLRDATPDPAQIRAWWTRWPHANLALATGRLLVLDVDGPAGQAALDALEHAHTRLPVTLTATTGRGAHLYFDAGAHRIASSAGRLGDGLDIRGHGGYAIAPPSRHAAGHHYRWRTRSPPAPLPAWLTELLTTVTVPAPRRAPLPQATGDRRQRYFAAALRAELADLANAQPGTRNDTLNRAAFRLAQLAPTTNASLDELADRLLDAALATGLPGPEARATIASALRAGAQHPRAQRP
jgi:hypothetical protein